MPNHKQIDPYTSFNFQVEIGGEVTTQFTEVSGLQVNVEVESIEEGGVNDFVHQLPKRTKYQNIVLKKGITNSDTLLKWFEEVQSGYFKRKSCAIILLDSLKQAKWRWEIKDAFPVKWTDPNFNAMDGKVAFESVELAHHGIKRKKAS
jgi:phage tail-like protein